MTVSETIFHRLLLKVSDVTMSHIVQSENAEFRKSSKIQKSNQNKLCT